MKVFSLMKLISLIIMLLNEIWLDDFVDNNLMSRVIRFMVNSRILYVLINFIYLWKDMFWVMDVLDGLFLGICF